LTPSRIIQSIIGFVCTGDFGNIVKENGSLDERVSGGTCYDEELDVFCHSPNKNFLSLPTASMIPSVLNKRSSITPPVMSCSQIQWTPCTPESDGLKDNDCSIINLVFKGNLICIKMIGEQKIPTLRRLPKGRIIAVPSRRYDQGHEQ
jgi:hypothetical protein